MFVPIKIIEFRLSRAHRTIENNFRILVLKWRIFRRPIIGRTETVEAVTKASVVLHNFVRIEECTTEEGNKYATSIKKYTFNKYCCD